MSLSAKYGYTPDKEAIDRQLALIAQNLENIASEDLYKACFGIMDQTTLSSDDTPASVRKMVEKVNGIPAAFPGWPLPASVCVYPNLGHVVAETRKDPALHVTTVAGCFPTSQSWIEVKLQEIELAVRGGADEIDIVLALNSFLAGDYETAGAEIKASRECIDRVAKELGRPVVLKVILETGLLATPELIADASFLAMENGAALVYDGGVYSVLSDAATPTRSVYLFYPARGIRFQNLRKDATLAALVDGEISAGREND